MKPTYGIFDNPTQKLQLEEAAKHCIMVRTFWKEGWESCSELLLLAYFQS